LGFGGLEVAAEAELELVVEEELAVGTDLAVAVGFAAAVAAGVAIAVGFAFAVAAGVAVGGGVALAVGVAVDAASIPSPARNSRGTFFLASLCKSASVNPTSLSIPILAPSSVLTSVSMTASAPSRRTAFPVTACVAPRSAAAATLAGAPCTTPTSSPRASARTASSSATASARPSTPSIGATATLCSPASAGSVARHSSASHLMLITVPEPRERLDKNAS